jgi:hypothetical protein
VISALTKRLATTTDFSDALCMPCCNLVTSALRQTAIHVWSGKRCDSDVLTSAYCCVQLLHPPYAGHIPQCSGAAPYALFLACVPFHFLLALGSFYKLYAYIISSQYCTGAAAPTTNQHSHLLQALCLQSVRTCTLERKRAAETPGCMPTPASRALTTAQQ